MGLAVTNREFWLVFHLAVSALFIHGFLESIFALVNLNLKRLWRLSWGTWGMSIAGWIAVISGTWLVYPGYRAKPPEGAELVDFPRSYLLSDSNLANWHRFGMEWKEHIGWLTPLLVTAVAFVVFRYGQQLAEDKMLRKTLTVLLVVAFVSAVIAGGLGALINKVAPNTFLDI